MIWIWLLLVGFMLPLLADNLDKLAKLLKQAKALETAEKLHEETYDDLLTARWQLNRHPERRFARDHYVASRIGLACAETRLLALRGEFVGTLNDIAPKLYPAQRKHMREQARRILQRAKEIEEWAAAESQFLAEADLREQLLARTRPGR